MSRARVVSLVPSATETLLGLGVRPDAVTRFCELPGAPTVGGTKDPSIEAVLAARPDLVVVCRDENRLEDVEAIVAAGCALHAIDIRAVDDVGPEVARLAAALGVPAPALDLPPARAMEGTAFAPIWRRPWMALGPDTYGASVLHHLGLEVIAPPAPESATTGDAARYPTVDLATVAAATPTVVVAADEPYPFGPRHEAELTTVAPVRFVDGRDLLWWGTRTPAALARLGEVLSDLR